MRALIKFRIKENFDSKEFIKCCGYNPNTNEGVIQNKKEKLLSNISEEDSEVAHNTAVSVFLISEHTDSTWGIIGNPAGNNFEVRIEHKNGKTIKKSCNTFVGCLMEYCLSEGLCIEFTDDISVMEKRSKSYVFFGNILSKNKFNIAIIQRSVEFITSLISFFLFIVATFITMFYQKNINEWLLGFIERFSTAMLVSSIVPFISVLHRYRELKREDNIEWSLR